MDWGTEEKNFVADLMDMLVTASNAADLTPPEIMTAMGWSLEKQQKMVVWANQFVDGLIVNAAVESMKDGQ